MNWRGLVGGILVLVLVAVVGLFYRNLTERTIVSGACTTEAKICPDGSAVGRVGPSCDFAPCAPPNVELSAGIAFVQPTGFASTTPPDADTVASYGAPVAVASSTDQNQIIIRRYPLVAGASATDIIHATAIGDASGAPVSPASFSAVTIGSYHYTVVALGRFEGVVHVAYYLAREQDVLRFDAIDRDVTNWTDPALDTSKLPAASALRTLLGTLTGQ